MADRQDPLRDELLTRQAAADVRTVAKGGAVQIAGQLSQRSFSFLFSLVAFRILGKGGYGLYRQAAQTLSIAGALGLAGFNYAAMRGIARARAAGDHGGVRGSARVGLGGAAVASAIVFAALLLFANPLASWFEEPRLAGLFRIGAAYVPLFALMQVLRYCTQGYKTMVPSVTVGNLIQPAARFVLGAGVLLAGFSLMGAVTTLVAATAIGAAAGAYYLQRMITAEERAATPRADTGAMVRFALPQAGASLLSVQSLGLGIIILGLASGNAEVGLFGIALQLQGPGTVFLGGIVNIWAPVVSDLHERGEIARLGSLYQTINRWIATFSFPVFAALMLEPDLFAAIFGREAEGAAPVIVILAVGNVFYTGTGPTGYVISMTGRPGVNFANSIVGVGLYFGLGLWIVPEHGAVGMAVVDAIVTALLNVARVIEAWILVGVQPFGRSFVKPVAATLAGAAALFAWRVIPGDSIPLEIAGVTVAACLYLVVLRALGLDPEERHVWDRIRTRALRGRRP